jgi:hypothetical protein
MFNIDEKIKTLMSRLYKFDNKEVDFEANGETYQFHKSRGFQNS